MYVIAGLGNPGRKYEKTRHNMGFRVIDELAERNDIRVSRLRHGALTGEGFIGGRKVLLVKPQTYMNLSGEAVSRIVDYYGVDMDQLLVIYDDFDTELGSIRIRRKGSAGSHNGMKSVVDMLDSVDFPRIRVGIGDVRNKDWVGFVIGRMSEEEEKLTAGAVTTAAEAAEMFVTEGIDMAMNRYNPRKQKKTKEPDEQEGNDQHSGSDRG